MGVAGRRTRGREVRVIVVLKPGVPFRIKGLKKWDIFRTGVPTCTTTLGWNALEDLRDLLNGEEHRAVVDGVDILGENDEVRLESMGRLIISRQTTRSALAK